MLIDLYGRELDFRQIWLKSVFWGSLTPYTWKYKQSQATQSASIIFVSYATNGSLTDYRKFVGMPFDPEMKCYIYIKRAWDEHDHPHFVTHCLKHYI